MKKYLITGGAGFIGSNFIHFLFNKYGNNVEIHNVDCLTYAGNLENLKDVSSYQNYFFHKVDIVDKENIKKIFAQYKIDFVVHFAAESHVDRSIQNSQAFLKTNILGTGVILDCVRDFKIKKMVHISTDEVYGSLSETGQFNELSPLAPNSPYAASKAGSDLLVRSYFETFGIPVCITRCSNNYGAYQFPEKMIPLIITNALENKKLPVYGKGLNIRDWIYVDDHSSAIDKVLNFGKIGEVYNIGGGVEITNIELVKMLLKILDKDENLIEFVKDRLGHDFRYSMNYTKLQNELGWKPNISLEQGIKMTVDWYLEHEIWWKNIKSGEYKKYYQSQYEKR